MGGGFKCAIASFVISSFEILLTGLAQRSHTEALTKSVLRFHTKTCHSHWGSCIISCALTLSTSLSKVFGSQVLCTDSLHGSCTEVLSHLRKRDLRKQRENILRWHLVKFSLTLFGLAAKVNLWYSSWKRYCRPSSSAFECFSHVPWPSKVA